MVRRILVPSLALVAILAAPAPASAHADTGTIEVVEAGPTGDLARRYVVVLRYENDGDPVEGTTVTLTASGPDGGAVSTAMTGRGDGRYEADVAFPGPGVWGVRIASEEPTAVAERTETVGAPTTTAATTTTTSTSTSTLASSSDGDGETDGESESGGGSVRPATVITLGIAALAIAFVLRRQRDRQRTAS